MKVLSEIGLIGILIFIGYIFVGDGMAQRTTRICDPVGWTGRMVESISMVVYPSARPEIQSWALSAEKNCRFVMFRQLYPKEFEEAMKMTGIKAK